MARHCKSFRVLAASAWLLVSTRARAYEDQATVDAALSYVVVAESASLPVHGAGVELGASWGLGPSTSVRAAAGYAALVDARESAHLGRLRLEALYALDVLQLVPFAGLGASVLAGEGADGGVQLRPGGHVVLGLDYLASRTWLVGLDLRAGLALEGHGRIGTGEVGLRVSRAFDTF